MLLGYLSCQLSAERCLSRASNAKCLVFSRVKVEQPEGALGGPGRKKKKRKKYLEEAHAEATAVTGLRVKLPRRQESDPKVHLYVLHQLGSRHMPGCVQEPGFQ